MSGASRALTLMLCACVVTGCSLTPIARYTAGFASATAIVVDRSQDAYRTANELYFEEQMSSVVREYEANPNWNPNSIQPLLTAKQMHVRRLLLDSLKVYARTLDRLENSPKSEAIDDAAAGTGAGLLAMSSSLNADLGGNKGIAITAAESNGLSTAVDALGKYLVARKVKRQLPAIVQSMDPTVDTICKLLVSDIGTLQTQTADDYSSLIQHQDEFIRHAGTSLDPVSKRAEIRQLPLLVQRSAASKELFDRLQLAIRRLALTHDALATAAQGKDPATLKAAIADLQETGRELGDFYQSLSLPTS